MKYLFLTLALLLLGTNMLHPFLPLPSLINGIAFGVVVGLILNQAWALLRGK